MKERLPSVHISHDKPQHYRHKYCLVCMTGLLGCRWHRYQQSTRGSRKRDLIFFTMVVLCFLHMLLFFYFWLVSRNNIYQITIDMYLYTNTYFAWSNVGLAVSSFMLAYLTGIVILCLFHVQFGHQLYLHPCHLLVTCLLEVVCIIVSVLVHIYWSQSWPLVFLSLWGFSYCDDKNRTPASLKHVGKGSQMRLLSSLCETDCCRFKIFISIQIYSPFLQLVAVLTVTAMAWLIVRQWFKLTLVYKMVWLPVMLVVLLALYLIPFWMNSPIISSTVPDKPGIIAMGGASNIAPENTLYAFKKALSLGVTRIQTTVQISFDGVPFLFQDNTLVRTTDFDEMRDSNISMVPMQNTVSELQTLNAGSWFLKHDPWGSAWRLSENETAEVNNQQIPTLSELLHLGTECPELELYLMMQPLPNWHPYCCDSASIIESVISQSESWFNRSNIYVPVWLYYNFTQRESFMPAEAHRDVTSLFMVIDSPNLVTRLRKNQKHSLTTIVSDVNSQWLLSILWCAGTDFVATRYIEDLQTIMSPIIHLTASTYTALWVTVDTFSVVAIIVFFVVHRIKLYGTNFSPEAISLNTARTKVSYRSRTMKEKLLRECTVVDSMDELEARDNDGMENRPAYSMSGHQTYSLSSLIGTELVTDTIRDRNSSVSVQEPGHSLSTFVTNRYSV